MDFLNALLNIEGGIVDLYYGNPEKAGIIKTDRTAFYDLYCTTGTGAQIIVEMQAVPQDFYKKRTLYYAAVLIQQQNVKGKDWDFSLYPVYSVNILNFALEPDKPKKKYVSRIQLMDIDDRRIFYDGLTLVYLELPLFTKNEKQLKTKFEQWVYALKYLPKLDKLPEALRNDVFEKLFEEAKIAKMSRKELNEYNKSRKILSDMNIVKHQLEKKDKAIETLSNDVVTLSNNVTTLSNQNAEQAKIIEEYRRKYGDLSGLN
jgi:predicted transposase/invertase (TIGR01784 family)